MDEGNQSITITVIMRRGPRTLRFLVITCPASDNYSKSSTTHASTGVGTLVYLKLYVELSILSL